ncbi:NYN domain-containing protein [Stachybotrys elegans]|uniref:NYN domain-containing protein n=1 Tax=Stachybotrys elegans TaxID=80388 RepID=A0A8K0WVT8_9HYPO|nr:NYN domain-containing protein [Stachybotrys elegans]
MAADASAKLAVLIDADNAQPRMVGIVLAEFAKYGTAFVKRAYGDWTSNGLNGWKEQLLENSIQPIQQFAYTRGKNSTDSAMIIDAMDLLYSNRFDGFCIVSSDSDFTRLASRIRESGLVVYGCGERKTPTPFVKACDKFIHIENLVPRNPLVHKNDIPMAFPTSPTSALPIPTEPSYSTAMDWLEEAAEETSDNEGWANLAVVGGLVTKRHPDFDPRTYGFPKLSELIASTSRFEMTRRIPAVGKMAVTYMRVK